MHKRYDDGTEPLIFGKFTNWKAQKMVKIETVLKLLDLNPVKLIYDLKMEKKVEDTVENFDELNADQKDLLF